MSKLSKRLQKLESILNPPTPKKWVRVNQLPGESREEAFTKAGIVEGDKVWIVQGVKPKIPVIPIVRKIIEVA